MKKKEIDLSKTIEPKSDQLNADDLVAGARTITITKITENGNDQQPISIHFEGDNGRPYKPNKGMRRLLVQLWGADASLFIGRKITLYRDAKTKWAGVEVGGIKVSHVSHIDEPTDVLVTLSRGVRRPVKIMPIMEKETLTTEHELFSKIKKAILSKKRTIEQIEENFILTEEIKKELTNEEN